MRVHVWIFQAIGYCTWKRYRHPTVPMPAVNEKRLHTFFNRTYQQWPKTAVSLQKTGDQMMGLKLNDATSNLQHACLVARVRDFWKTMVRFYRYRGDVKIREQRYHERVPCMFLLCVWNFVTTPCCCQARRAKSSPFLIFAVAITEQKISTLWSPLPLLDMKLPLVSRMQNRVNEWT